MLSAAALAQVPITGAAAPDEIRVLSDDIAALGDANAEFHVASVRARASRVAGGDRFVQGLAELSYGVRPDLEVSVQFPVSHEPAGWRANGINLEAQYIAPHDRMRGWYWGARTEIGRSRSPLADDRATTLEFRPIIGWRQGSWHAGFNGSFVKPLTGSERHLRWEPSARIGRSVAPRTVVGLEYYVQAAEAAQGAPGRRKLVLLAVDTKLNSVDLSFGFGRGTGPSGDGPVVKAIAGFDL